VAIDALNKSSTKYFSKQKQSSYVLQRVPFSGIGGWISGVGFQRGENGESNAKFAREPWRNPRSRSRAKNLSK